MIFASIFTTVTKSKKRSLLTRQSKNPVKQLTILTNTVTYLKYGSEVCRLVCKYHYLLHIVRLLLLMFTDLQWGKNVLWLRPCTFLLQCKSVKIEKSLTIYTIYRLKNIFGKSVRNIVLDNYSEICLIFQNVDTNGTKMTPHWVAE